jgi:hypothetical protein
MHGYEKIKQIFSLFLFFCLVSFLFKDACLNVTADKICQTCWCLQFVMSQEL